MREGFRESFKPLILQFEKPEDSDEEETEEDRKKKKITENVFTQNLALMKKQDSQIKQLQDNQEAITNKLNQNRLAITEGFDKLDEVKRWDLQQLPGFAATEDSQEKSEDEEDEEEEEEEKGATTEKKRYYKIRHRKRLTIMIWPY